MELTITCFLNDF